LIADVYERQERILESRLKLEELLVKAHVEAGKAWEIGTTPEDMNGILQDIRHAQWRWDYIAASHGGSFHSPVESGRVLSTGIALAQEARVKLARVLTKKGVDQPISYPDISTKAKAQEYIGLDMKKENAAKKEFLEKRYPEWVNQPFAK
jgi:nitrite reductase (cytochrome c-552)